MRSIRYYCVAIVIFAGCGIFSTRTPEPPTGSPFIWSPATTVDDLIANFTGTLTQLDASNYVRVFISTTDSTGSGAKSFVFTPAPGLDQGSRAVFTVWNPESERAWLSNLKSRLAKDSKLTVILSNSKTDESSSPATYSADYTISIPSSPSSLIPGVVQGSLQLQMLLTTDAGTKEWRILSWSDFLPKSGTGSTWTDLKVKLSS
jgi:hypothetical protein